MGVQTYVRTWGLGGHLFKGAISRRLRLVDYVCTPVPKFYDINDLHVHSLPNTQHWKPT